jgi:hypothetical protein
MSVLICIPTLAPILVSAKAFEHQQYKEQAARALEGVWDVTVSILKDCQTGQVDRTVRAFNMFLRGGTLTEEPARANLILRSPSFGTWRHVGDHRYTAVFRFPRFNAVPIVNPDGSFTYTFRDTQRVTRTIELDLAGNTFVATARVEHLDANDNLLDTGCATEIAARLE